MGILLASDMAAGGGYAFGPSDRELWMVLALPVLGGLLTGVLTGWRRWRFWRPLGIWGAIALGVLLLAFLSGRQRLYAALAVPLMLVIYLLSHALAQVVWVACRLRKEHRR